MKLKKRFQQVCAYIGDKWGSPIIKEEWHYGEEGMILSGAVFQEIYWGMKGKPFVKKDKNQYILPNYDNVTLGMNIKDETATMKGRQVYVSIVKSRLEKCVEEFKRKARIKNKNNIILTT